MHHGDSAWKEKIFSVNADNFDPLAVEVFHFQYEFCPPYRDFCDLLDITPGQVTGLHTIPFLPVETFKNREVVARSEGLSTPHELVFSSSGTTGDQTSRHLVIRADMYQESFLRGFKRFYGPAGEWSIFALLPSYLERQGSSLVYMVEELRKLNPDRGGFYLYDYDRLVFDLKQAVRNGEKILLIGVAFALLDLADYLNDRGGMPFVFPADTVIMETGGMKGRKREVDREQMHRMLKNTFGVNTIHSEYGMTELLSQAYSEGDGLFRTPPWMRILIRDVRNPLKIKDPLDDRPVRGGVNVVDLANLYACSFLAVGDAGELYADGAFRIEGRLENEQLRGCNMLIE